MRKWRLILLITIAFFCLSATSEAAKWRWLADNSIFTLYVDTESISGGPAGPKEAWFKWDVKKPGYAYALSYERYYIDKKSCRLQIATYFSNGTHKHENVSCVPKSIISETIGENQWNAMFQ